MGQNVKIDVGVYFQNSQFICLDDHCWIDRGVMILAGADRSQRPRRHIPNRTFPVEKGIVHIGKRVHVGSYCIISGIGGVYVSDECGFSSGVKAFSFSNHFRSDEFPANQSYHFGPLVEHERTFMIEGPIFLDTNVGVALNAVLLPGVTIKKNSFVAINSVVSTSFEENSLIAGNPAKRVKDRFKPE